MKACRSSICEAYATGTAGIDRQVDDPFYGLNQGSTRIQVEGAGDPALIPARGADPQPDRHEGSVIV